MQLPSMLSEICLHIVQGEPRTIWSQRLLRGEKRVYAASCFKQECPPVFSGSAFRASFVSEVLCGRQLRRGETAKMEDGSLNTF